MNKLITTILTLALLFSFSGAAYANETADMPVLTNLEMPMYYSATGQVNRVSDVGDNVYLTLESGNENTGEIVLIVHNKTIIAEAQTGLPATADSINVGDSIKAYYSPVMTRSLPPQTNAFAVLTGYTKEEGSFDYLKVKEVENLEDGSIRVLSGDGSYFITISDKNPTRSFKTKDIPSIYDITVGSELLVYYEIMALSYPGQTGSLDTIVVTLKQDAKVEVFESTGEISINGEMCSLSDNEKIVVKEDGVTLIPVRKVLESLGFTVTWNSDEYSVHAVSENKETKFSIGSSAYENQKTRSILPETQLIEGKTYAPVQLLNEVLEIETILHN